MGAVDLAMKCIELFLYGLVLASLGLMKVCPWRKSLLAERLKDGKSLLYYYDDDVLINSA